MRRRFISNTEIPVTKTTGDIERNRRFEKPSETRKAKRVRFDDAETDDSSRGHEEKQSPRCDAPKTSEYAYFRKVKDGAVNSQFRAMQKEKKPLKSSKIDHFLTEAYEASEKFDPSTENLNFSISGESAGPSGHKHFASPPVSKYGQSYEIKRKVLTDKTKTRLPLPIETVTPVRQSLATPVLNHETESSENQCMDEGIFREKRKRLCQWVAHTTSSQVENLRRNGPDVVSFLLSRLIPKGNENNDSSKGDADNSSGPLTVYEPDNLEKELPLSYKTHCHKYLSKTCSGGSSEIELMEWESFSPGFPSVYHKECDLQNKTMDHPGRRSSEIVLSELKRFDSGFLYNYHRDRDLHNETMDLDQHSDSRICNSTGRQHDFSFCLPFESFRSLGAFHFKDLHEFGPIIGHGRQEPYRHSLEMDFDLRRDGVHTRKDVCHRLANSWNVDQQSIVDNILDTKGYNPSPLFSSRYLSTPLPNYVSMHEFVQNLDDMKYAMVEPGHFSLTSPSSPKCITFPEDKNAEKVLSNSSLMFSYSDLRWPKKKISDCIPRSGFSRKCLPASGDDPSPFHAWQFPENENGSYSLPLLKDAPQEPFSPFYQGAYDNYLFSSTLHSPLDAFMNSPLLLNHVSHDILVQELYSDDYNEMGF